MKNMMMKATGIMLYLLLLSGVLEFKINLIINPLYLCAVIIGSAILTLIGTGKTKGRSQLISKIKWNLLTTGYLVTFLAHVAHLPQDKNPEVLYTRVIMNFLPLFYAFIFYMLIDMLADSYVDHAKNLDESGGRDASNLLESFDLTRREVDIAKEIFSGLSNSDIGEKLFISENTVKKHIYNIFKKVDVKSRAEFINKFIKD